jgi:hypothetical protein
LAIKFVAYYEKSIKIYYKVSKSQEVISFEHMAAIVRKKDEAVLKEKSLEEQLKFQKQVNYITNKIHGARDTDQP